MSFRQMKILGLLLLTSVMSIDSTPSDNSSVDIGCTSNRPALCPNGLCYEGYTFCSPFKGCTVAPNLLMCPDGMCTSDFSLCATSRYKCELDNFSRCSDGVCRSQCDGISTNGCPSELPFFCPTGKCAKSMLECTGDLTRLPMFIAQTIPLCESGVLSHTRWMFIQRSISNDFRRGCFIGS